MPKPIPATAKRLDLAIDSALESYREHKTVSWVLYGYDAAGEVHAYSLSALPESREQQAAVTRLLHQEGIVAYAVSLLSELRVTPPAGGPVRNDTAIISATATAQDFEVAIHVVATDHSALPAPELAFRSGHAHEGPATPRDPAKSVTIVTPPWMTRLLVTEH